MSKEFEISDEEKERITQLLIKVMKCSKEVADHTINEAIKELKGILKNDE